jgi:hypothetical protein
VEVNLLTNETREQNTRTVILLHAGFDTNFHMQLQVRWVRSVASDDCIGSIKATHRVFNERGFVRLYGRRRLYW